LFPGYVDRGWQVAFDVGSIKFFNAQDSFGNYYVGVAKSGQIHGSADQIRNPTILSGSGAIAGFYTDHNNSRFENTQRAIDAFAAYKMLLRTPQLRQNLDIGLRARFGVSLIGGQFYEEGHRDKALHGDIDIRSSIGIGGHFGNPDGCFFSEFEAYREFTPALKNVLDPAHTLGIKAERDIARAAASICTGQNEGGPTSGFRTSGVFLNDVIADAYLSHLEYWYRGVSVGAGVQGSFSELPPLFHEGGQNYYTGQVNVNWGGRNVRVQGALPRDDRSRAKASVSVHLPVGRR